MVRLKKVALELAKPARYVIGEARFLWWKARNDFDISGVPHLDDATFDLLKTEMAKASSYLEFGSGGSTVLAAQTVRGPVCSVESDKKFLRAVQRKIASLDLPAPNMIFADTGLTGRWGHPIRPWYSRKWRDYAEAPWLKMSALPDVILIDGRFRAACALSTLLHFSESGKVATVIIDDYDDYEHRPNYTLVEEFAYAPVRIGRSLVFKTGRVNRGKCLSVLERLYRDTW
ncbi:hypothetical protein ABID19_002458 [Mesorhizobium robiniae]|uniref:Class I SAM-dependent methyltransferase n=1 Tax=Mesorhizobium robiniae TaxID=559315 RepID=A0ABV2GN05_9HYPH